MHVSIFKQHFAFGGSYPCVSGPACVCVSVRTRYKYKGSTVSCNSQSHLNLKHGSYQADRP